jgi:hypothetical protein
VGQPGCHPENEVVDEGDDLHGAACRRRHIPCADPLALPRRRDIPSHPLAEGKREESIGLVGPREPEPDVGPGVRGVDIALGRTRAEG